jgi:hypothetical protein
MLGNINSAPVHSDKAQSQRAAKDYLKFILVNLKQLDNLQNGKNYKEAALSLSQWKNEFTPKQLSFINVIYEKVMEGFGLPSFAVTFKPNKKNLKF